MNFNLICQNIETLISKNYLPETLTSERESLISQFEKLREHDAVYLSLVSDDSSKNVLTLMLVITERCNHTLLLIDKYISSCKTSDDTRHLPLRLEQMPLPKFDGRIRNYPSLKKDFCELVLPNITAKGCAFTLRQCVRTIGCNRCFGML